MSPILILPVQGPTYQEIILGTTSATLIGYWPFDSDGSDISGNSYDLTPAGGTPPTIVGGYIGVGATSVPASIGSRWAGSHTFPANFFDDWSATAWVNVAANRNNARSIIWTTNGPSPQFGMDLVDVDPNVPVGAHAELQINHRGGTLKAGVVPTNGTWVHVAVTQEQPPGQRNLYVNGSNVLTFSGSGTTTTGVTDIMVGNYAPSPTLNGFEGLIDEVTLWQGALDAADILAQYNAGP